MSAAQIPPGRRRMWFSLGIFIALLVTGQFFEELRFIRSGAFDDYLYCSVGHVRIGDSQHFIRFPTNSYLFSFAWIIAIWTWGLFIYSKAASISLRRSAYWLIILKGLVVPARMIVWLIGPAVPYSIMAPSFEALAVTTVRIISATLQTASALAVFMTLDIFSETEIAKGERQKFANQINANEA